MTQPEPKFDRDIELAKINVASQYRTGNYLPWSDSYLPRSSDFLHCIMRARLFMKALHTSVGFQSLRAFHRTALLSRNAT